MEILHSGYDTLKLTVDVDIPEEFLEDGEISPEAFAVWAEKLVKLLLLAMPMQPHEDMRQQLENRRKVLWAV